MWSRVNTVRSRYSKMKRVVCNVLFQRIQAFSGVKVGKVVMRDTDEKQNPMISQHPIINSREPTASTASTVSWSMILTPSIFIPKSRKPLKCCYGTNRDSSGLVFQFKAEVINIWRSVIPMRHSTSPHPFPTKTINKGNFMQQALRLLHFRTSSWLRASSTVGNSD